MTKRSVDYAKWYNDVVVQAELADYSPVKGCMVIRPNGYVIWEAIQAELDKKFKETGHVNAYFPIFIPESFMTKEAEHVEGFAPECAVVTHAGGKKLEENLFVRPTSETIMYAMYSKWINSYRDLPLLINQWANVVRWEMRTRLFLRTTEFLWQEGHTAHATLDEAEEECIKILDIYADFHENFLAVPVMKGLKSEKEKFAGGLRTYCIESMMGDKRALQAGTTHNLGQNFSKAFDVRFQNKDGQMDYVWQTSWGVSTRMIGGLIMVHGDDKGIKIPPKIAQRKIVLVPIWKKDEEIPVVLEKAEKLLSGFPDRSHIYLDDRENYSPGWKFNEWELKGIPLRIELGPKDIENESVMFARRDTGEKFPVKWSEFNETAQKTLDDIQKNMYDQALKFREDNTITTDNYGEFKEINNKDSGFFSMHWCGAPDCEDKIQEETKATIRVIPFDDENEEGKCILCGKKSEKRVVFARAY
ncbi:proline--tRNA ligase [candidate division KSB1 bacterium]